MTHFYKKLLTAQNGHAKFRAYSKNGKNKKQMKIQTLKRPLALFGAVVVLASLVIQAIPPQVAHAGQITARKLTLRSGTTDSDSNGIPDGGSMPAGVVNHEFSFSVPTSQDLGSVTLEYCTTAAPVPNGIQCDAPAGLSTATASLGASTTGVTFTTATPAQNAALAWNKVVVSAASLNFGFAGPIVFRVDGVANPTAINQTFFVRISTHESLNGTLAAIDTGTVAASTADPIELSGTMPESLVFCTGQTVGETFNVPDCTTATEASIDFNQLFSPQSTTWATSQMAASTNAGSGYAIAITGRTLMSGSNQINAVTSDGSGGTNDVVKTGISQFGLNTVENDQPNQTSADPVNDTSNPVSPASADVTLPTGGLLYTGSAYGDYAVGGDKGVAKYRFASGDIVASSTGASDPQVFTSTYMVNVPGSQPAGTYSTTLTYICTPTF